MRHLIVFCCLCTALLSDAVRADGPLNMSISHIGYWTGSSGSPQVIYSDTNGAAQFGPRVVLNLARRFDPAPPPPYQIVLSLGPGITSMVPLSLPAGTTCQPAGGGGADPISIQCEMTSQLGGGGVQFQFALDAGAYALFAGTSVTARYTVDHAEYPLPDPPVCTNISGQNGCVERTASVFESFVKLNSLTIADPTIIGQNTTLQVSHQVRGYDGGRITTTTIDLPEQLEYVGFSSPTIPTHTCSNERLPSGTDRVSCEGNIRHVTSNGALRNGSFGVIVRTREGIKPPGPVRIVASIGNGALPAPANCSEMPDQDRCAEVIFALAPPPIVDLRLISASAPEPLVLIGPTQGPFRLEYRNAGGLASAIPTRLAAKLPAGFEFVQLSSASGTLSCTASGAIVDGQEVSCARSTTVPASSSTFFLEMNLRASPGLTAELGNLIVWAITDSAEPDSQALMTCASEPDRGDCLWLSFDVRPPCPGGPEDSIYCEGFQRFVPPVSP